jgi:hypothetical protein
MKNLEEVKADALELESGQRAALVKALIESLDEPSPEEHERLWFEEADRRQREVAEGRVTMVPGAEVMARLAAIG